MATCWSNLRSRGTVVQAVALGVAVTAVLAIAGPIAAWLGGSNALAAAATAAMICGAGATAALLVTRRLRAPQHLLAALTVGMGLRTGIPLTVGLWLHLQRGPLAEAGLLYYLLIFYPLTLAMETLLSLPPTNRQSTPALSPYSKTIS